MPTAEKAKTIEQTKQWYDKAVGVVFTDYRGLKVKQIQDLRTQVRSKGGEIHVIKNTLFRLAAGSEVADSLTSELHNGTTAFAFVFENESAVAKTLLDYAKSSRTLVIKGGYFGGKSFSAKQVEELATLPPKEVLIAQVIGAIAAPLSNLVGVIEALYADPIRVIGAVADKVAENSPKPVAVESTVIEPVIEPVAEVQPETTEVVPESAPADPVSEEPASVAPAADAPTE